MKQGRDDRRKVTIRYLHDAVSGKTTLTLDVEVPEDEMPHEHRKELREMAEELLGVPLSSLPEEVTVNLRRPAHAHPHPHEEETSDDRGSEGVGGREGVKA